MQEASFHVEDENRQLKPVCCIERIPPDIAAFSSVQGVEKVPHDILNSNIDP